MTEATVQAIYLFPARGSAPVGVEVAEAVAGGGLKGDQPRKPDKGISFISVEAWADANAELGTDLPPHTRRANVLLSGLDLSTLIGKTVHIGAVRVAVRAETKPCSIMDQQHLGLREALVPAMRGGVNGEILTNGTFAVGDRVIVK